MASKLISRVAHVGIRVHSLERARDFYAKLGFEFVLGPVGPEPVAIVKHPNGIEVNFILNANEADAPNILMDVPVSVSLWIFIIVGARLHNGVFWLSPMTYRL